MTNFLYKLKPLWQFLQFSLVGLTNTIISYVIYATLVWMGMYYLLASVLSFIVSVLNSFYWNDKYVFREEKEGRSVWTTLIKTFISYSLTGLIVSNILLYIWIDIFEISCYIAPIINLVITVPLNFILNKNWAFKKNIQ